ncbi:uncharacterized protein N7459_000060 [Penicillium hispanicum]|uniref:uncharacterized protein n=1 Tax=Penicillium hispanicum TaxID=1080232 RepID=UPI00254160B9|nr:uncharacterized protein N7459_000060 [Penicillium hispanicum]KAJ5593852.1 hypothetical protein N7459_000060 [Penicillium hispanicum]
MASEISSPHRSHHEALEVGRVPVGLFVSPNSSSKQRGLFPSIVEIFDSGLTAMQPRFTAAAAVGTQDLEVQRNDVSVEAVLTPCGYRGIAHEAEAERVLALGHRFLPGVYACKQTLSAVCAAD